MSINEKLLNEAILAYTAQGGQYASRYPYTSELHMYLLNVMSSSTYVTQEDIYRKIDLPEADYTAIFDELYDKGTIPISFGDLQSFTKERSRAFSYGGSHLDYVIFKIPKGTEVHGEDISDRSIYPVEKEVLLGKNSFKSDYDRLEWTSNNHMILVLRP